MVLPQNGRNGEEQPLVAQLGVPLPPIGRQSMEVDDQVATF